MNWTITRQELVLFHARHKRIRFVYKHDGEPVPDNENEAFKNYRHHAKSIIDALEGIFREFPTGAEIGIEASGTCPTDKPQSYKLEIKLPRDLNKRIFLAYLIYWRMCLHYEGWKENSKPNQIVVEIIKKVGEKNKDNGTEAEISFEIECSAGESGKYPLSHLLSTLPISPHWDLWGLFSNDCGKKTLLTDMKNCVSPVYAAQLRFHAGKAPNDFRSRMLLGYPASLRACYTDSARYGFVTTFVSEEDYYTYCYDPIEAVMGENEINTYRAYGLLYDAITLALSAEKNPGNDIRGEPANRKTDNENIVFYIAYPIKTSLGRLHFWHIWLRPDSDDATLEQLWASWWPLHQHILNWPELHTALATELEQLDIAYAQGEILTDIIDYNDKGIEFSPNKSVCEHAYMLFPVDCVCDGKQVWRYQEYQINKIVSNENKDFFKEARDGLLKLDGIKDNSLLKQELIETTNNDLKLIFGHKWSTVDPVDRKRGNEFCQKFCEEYKNYDKANKEQSTAILFRNKDKTVTKNLQSQRHRRLIEQQRFIAEHMNLSMEAQMQRFERERKRARDRLVDLLTDVMVSDPWDESILSALAGEDWEKVVLFPGNKFTDEKIVRWDKKPLRTAGEIARLLYDSQPQQQLISQLSGGYYLYLSRILELDPVKGFTHCRDDNLRRDVFNSE